MTKNLEISEFLDIYGALLSKRQRQIAEDFYNFDLSLAEIGQNYGITRQAVLDALRAAEKSMQKYESVLGVRRLKSGIGAALFAKNEAERLEILQKLS